MGESNAFEIVPLSELVEVRIGKTPSRADPRFWGGEHPWATIADLNQGRDVVLTKEGITDEAIACCKPYVVEPGTLLMSFKLSIGKLAFAGVPLVTNEAIAAFPVRDETVTSPEYLFYALQVVDLIAEGNRAAKGRTLNKQIMLDLPVPFVRDREVQDRIVERLDAAYRLRVARFQSARLAEGIEAALLREAFE